MISLFFPALGSLGNKRLTARTVGCWPPFVFCLGNKWQTFSTLSSAWSDWSQWTSCSRTCGAGSRSRGRECKNAIQSDSCQGEKLQAETCRDIICPSTSSNALLEREGKAIFILTFFIPVDGIWLNWGQWSSCGVS